MDMNHEQWLETVPVHQQAVVPDVVARWNEFADEFNQWHDLGWDERDKILLQYLGNRPSSNGNCHKVQFENERVRAKYEAECEAAGISPY